MIIEIGATFGIVITWRDENDALVDLTGYTARMQIRETAKDAAQIIELTTENGRIALGGALGTITLSIAVADTEAITDERGAYDLELINPSTEVTRLIKGQVTFPSNVTR